MRSINLDASNWTTVLDFHAALLPALAAPERHGDSVPAVADSVIAREIDAVEPPFTVEARKSRPLS